MQGQEHLLWRGDFNWQGDVTTYYTSASTEEKAFINFCVKISKDVHYGLAYIINYFTGTTKYTITIVIRKGAKRG